MNRGAGKFRLGEKVGMSTSKGGAVARVIGWRSDPNEEEEIYKVAYPATVKGDVEITTERRASELEELTALPTITDIKYEVMDRMRKMNTRVVAAKDPKERELAKHQQDALSQLHHWLDQVERAVVENRETAKAAERAVGVGGH